MNSNQSAPTAVIELGTTSVRMVIGQVSGSSSVHILDELEQAVSLGSDTLVTGSIGEETTSRCVAALASFRDILNQYGIPERNVSVIATSAVREASNKDRFCDRILVTTGFHVEVIDKSEVSRLTYQAVQPQLRKHPSFRTSNVMVMEVGGGSTEVMLLRKGRVTASHLYRLGSLRLRSQIDSEDILPREQAGLIRAEMTQMLVGLQSSLKLNKNSQIVLLGAEARFACSHSKAPVDSSSGLFHLDLAKLKKLTSSVSQMSVDDVVEKYGLTYTEAETLAPALLIAQIVAEEFNISAVHVSDVSLRTGVLLESVKGEQWTPEYRKQIINSADVCARTHHVDIRHARNVAAYGLTIIDALHPRYPFSERERVIFQAAALMHETGQQINTASHHKHSFYIIQNSDLFGIGGKDLLQTALVARYHRRAAPKSTHREYMDLDQDARISVSKLAAVLRLANALDRLHTARRLKLSASLEDDALVVRLPRGTQLSLIRQRVQDRSTLFRDIFGMPVILRMKRS